jgi:hypothetical protein
MHKIPWVTSKNAMKNFKNAQNPMRNFQKCKTSNEELPKMYKISWGTSKNAQNPMRNFQKCTRCFWHMLSAFSFQLTVYIFWHEVKLMTFADWLKIVL